MRLSSRQPRNPATLLDLEHSRVSAETLEPEAHFLAPGPGAPRLSVRLCARCGVEAIVASSPFDPFFCTRCGPAVIALNQAAGRLVVPVAPDPRANCALFPLPTDADEEALGVDRFTPDFRRQLRHLETWRRERTRFLLEHLGVSPAEGLPLGAFRTRAAALRLPALRPKATLQSLAAWFSEYLVDSPHASAAFRVRANDAASQLVAELSDDVLGPLLSPGYPKLKAAARHWARTLLDELAPVPAAVATEPCVLPARRKPALRWLEDLLFRKVLARWKHFVPPVPGVPLKIECPQQTVPAAVFVAPEDERLEWLPEKAARKARLVLALADAPPPLKRPVTYFTLSTDPSRRWWILWAEWLDAEGRTSTRPAGVVLRSGFADFEAAYLLMEFFLGRLRERGLVRAPTVALTGLLGELLVADLLRRVGLGA